MSRSIKVSHKSSEILTVILPLFKASMNLAHIKCLSMLLGALCTVQTVCLSKLAGAFGDKASRESSFRRIQRFMAQLVLDFDVVAEYLRSRIPLDGPYTLTMDRTSWKLGELNINALVLGIAYDHMSFPILFRLLPKRGNSNYKERIDIMQRFIRLFGRGSIKCLVADREFVGHEWFKWLNDNAVRYHIRIRDNSRVEDPRKPFLLTRKDGPLKRCSRDGPYQSYRATLRGCHHSLHPGPILLALPPISKSRPSGFSTMGGVPSALSSMV